MIPAHHLGRVAEQRAAALLIAHGYELLERNYRCRMGELDLVARRGALLVIVEVRLRTSRAFGGAAASISASKRRRILLAARHLLARRPALARLRVRFDAVLLDGEHLPIEWIEGAFDAAT